MWMNRMTFGLYFNLDIYDPLVLGHTSVRMCQVQLVTVRTRAKKDGQFTYSQQGSDPRRCQREMLARRNTQNSAPEQPAN